MTDHRLASALVILVFASVLLAAHWIDKAIERRRARRSGADDVGSNR